MAFEIVDFNRFGRDRPRFGSKLADICIACLDDIAQRTERDPSLSVHVYRPGESKAYKRIAIKPQQWREVRDFVHSEKDEYRRYYLKLADIGKTFVALSPNRKVLGGINMLPRPKNDVHRVMLSQFYVTPEEQGRGVGSELLEDVESYLEVNRPEEGDFRGVPIFANALLYNPSLDFYTNRDYVVTGKIIRTGIPTETGVMPFYNTRIRKIL